MYSVILCGGSGTRLWPLSRKNFPKQFLNLYSDNSLLQETFLRMQKIMPAKNIFLVTNKDSLYNVLNQIRDISPDFPKENIIVEPDSLNTAPAIALALKYLKDKVEIKAGEPILILPSDHFIEEELKYLDIMTKAADDVSKKNKIGTIGITPTKPETGYGYIRKGAKSGDAFSVLEFKEKPHLELAEQYLESGEYLWNSGMYIFSLDIFFEELRSHALDIFNLTNGSLDDLLSNFSDMPSISIDNAVSEKSKNMLVFEGDFGWSDIGSFDSLSETLKNGYDNHVSIDSKNIFAHSENKKLIATSGVSDLIIIENNDCILIQRKGRSEDVKKVVEHLKSENRPELEHNIVVHRPWGRYEVLIDMPRYKVKKVVVYPGARLSLQSHRYRSEHWVVVRGEALVTNGDAKFFVKENESTYIPALNKHRLENKGNINLEIVEVQTGEYTGEDDIERYDDEYDRLS